MEAFMLRAVVAGVGLSLIAGPLGLFVVWRRLAYFGDTLAHSSLLGVILAFLFHLPMNGAILLVCLGVALLLHFLEARPHIATDTALGILSHGALALALVVISLARDIRIDLMGYLFGDILATTWTDIQWIYGGGALVLGLLWRVRRPLLNMTVNEPLARVDGVPVAALRFLFMVMVAVTVALAIKIVGALLVTALLIIPAAAARPFSPSPGRMAILSTVIAVSSVLMGLMASYHFDTPSGPSIVLAAAGFFFFGTLKKA